MRIIAGHNRGRKLKSVPGMKTRPTADRVKEAVFSSIDGFLYRCRFLDVFGGTGSISLEAVSRGAEEAVILEKDADMYQTEYIGDAYNPMDEMYSRLCGVSWYEEQGFCKLEFFNMDYIPDPHNVCRRIYFNNREKKSGE